MVSNPSGRLRTLRQRSDFLEISRNGRQISSCDWIVVAYRSNNQDFNRYGWTIPKYVGIAVIRNRLRRWCREFFRGKSFSESCHRDVCIIFRRKDKEFFKNVRRDEFFGFLERAVRRIEKERPASG
ncbi:MAG: ribonuclease P protein component [Bdellovibrionales bacterium]|nr:ribonuclease P protein component [Bdellovibrionales bacterium]